MHESVREWVATQTVKYNLSALDTLEVGSLNENGGTKDLFTGKFIGVDMRPGPDVDEVMNAHDLTFEDESFDVVICTEMLEHDPAFWISLEQIKRVLRPGGHLLLTTRGNGFPEHAYPSDYFRFMPASMALIAELAGCELVDSRQDIQAPGIHIHGVRQ